MKERTNITLGPKLKAEAIAYCREQETTLSSLISHLLFQYLGQFPSKNGAEIHGPTSGLILHEETSKPRRRGSSPAPGQVASLVAISKMSWQQYLEGDMFADAPKKSFERVFCPDTGDPLAVAVELEENAPGCHCMKGDLAVLLPKSAPATGDVVIVRTKTKALLIGKWPAVRASATRLKLQDMGPNSSSKELAREDISWVHPVKWVIPMGKGQARLTQA